MSGTGIRGTPPPPGTSGGRFAGGPGVLGSVENEASLQDLRESRELALCGVRLLEEATNREHLDKTGADLVRKVAVRMLEVVAEMIGGGDAK